MRRKYVDIAKGIGILFVVLGHYQIGSELGKYIFAFHMPLFIVLSALIWKRLNIRSMCVSWYVGGC